MGQSTEAPGKPASVHSATWIGWTRKLTAGRGWKGNGVISANVILSPHTNGILIAHNQMMASPFPNV